MSIPYVSFVVFHLIYFEQSPKFILKCHTLVVFFLYGDVLLDGIDVRLTDGEASVSLLPGKVMKVSLLLVNPLGTACFDGLYQICDGDGARHDAEDVDVIFCSAYANAGTMDGV